MKVMFFICIVALAIAIKEDFHEIRDYVYGFVGDFRLSDKFENIYKVKRSDIFTTEDGRVFSVEKFFNDTAGLDGVLNWSYFVSDGGRNVVQLDIKRIVNNVSSNAVVQWLVNPNTDYVELSYVEIDGVAKSKNFAVLSLSLWSIENVAKVKNNVSAQGLGYKMKKSACRMCHVGINIDNKFLKNTREGGLNNKQIHELAAVINGFRDRNVKLNDFSNICVHFDSNYKHENAKMTAVTVVHNGKPLTKFFSYDEQLKRHVVKDKLSKDQINAHLEC